MKHVPIGLRAKARFLWVVQRIILWYWKLFETREIKAWRNDRPNGYEMVKKPCRLVYLRWKGKSIQVDLWYEFKGFCEGIRIQ